MTGCIYLTIACVFPLELYSLRASESESCSVMSAPLWPHGLYSPWNSPDQNTGVGSLSLLQGIFQTQESNWGLLHCRKILYNWTIERKGFVYITSNFPASGAVLGTYRGSVNICWIHVWDTEWKSLLKMKQPTLPNTDKNMNDHHFW